jgi:hypothetical protein
MTKSLCSKISSVCIYFNILDQMLTTQTGSRFVQKQLNEDENGGKEGVTKFTEFVLSEVGDRINELMIDR